jgi:hypothetical protein
MTGLKPETKTARNERRKAAATTLNALSVAALVGSTLQPFLGGRVDAVDILLGAAIFIAMQGGLHAILRGLED